MIIIPYRRGNLPLRHLLRCPRRTLVVPSAGLRASNGTTRIPARSSIAAKGSLPWSYRLLRPSYSTLPSSDGRSAQPADDPNFQSILDRPPELVRPPRRRHGPGLVLLALIPLTALGLGTWQVQRLKWKTELLATLEDRLSRPPLPLPAAKLDADAVATELDHRRVTVMGRFAHDREMLVGPRTREGVDGYMVVTPLELGEPGDADTTVLVNRGWISRKMRRQEDRERQQAAGGGRWMQDDALPRGEVTVEGLLRKPWKRNMFTPANRPEKGEFYFPDVAQMAALAHSQPVWIEATMEPDWLRATEMEKRGVPIGRPAEVNVRNNHAQYILTWYGLAAATSIMLWLVVRKPPSEIARRVKRSRIQF